MCVLEASTCCHEAGNLYILIKLAQGSVRDKFLPKLVPQHIFYAPMRLDAAEITMHFMYL